jgi:hypothetical protein
MLRLEGRRDVQFCDGLSRRDFLRAGGLAMGLTLTELAALQGAAPRSGEPSCIQLFLVGGPSHLETWDPKPMAPDGIRGPFRPIRTNVPGIHISEHLPLMARMADRYSIIRSIFHKEAPIHETGHQLMQTGYLFQNGIERPHMGSVVSRLRGRKAGIDPWVMLPGPIGNTGVTVSHGQTAGFLGDDFKPFCLQEATPDVSVCDDAAPYGLDPARLDSPAALIDAVDGVQKGIEGSSNRGLTSPARLDLLFNSQAKRAFDIEAESPAIRARYGENTFGQACLLARRLVEHGVRLVTVNMFDTVFNRVTWDCHANGGDLCTTLDDYRTTLCPMLDQAFTALLADLGDRGLIQSTVVLCMGEFGRTPRINNRGGRDHWPNVWSGLIAGGPIQGGRVIGSSDRHGLEPRDRPVHPSEIVATVYRSLGIDPAAALPGPNGEVLRLVEAKPIGELF